MGHVRVSCTTALTIMYYAQSSGPFYFTPTLSAPQVRERIMSELLNTSDPFASNQAGLTQNAVAAINCAILGIVALCFWTAPIVEDNIC